MTTSFGPNYAGTCVDEAGTGDVAYPYPSRAAGACTGGGASASLNNTGQRTDYLKATNFGFNVTSGPGAAIAGIQITIKRKCNVAGQGKDLHVYAVKGGSPVGSDLASGSYYPTSLGDATYGGPTSLLGTTWTPSDINSSGFGVRVQSENVNAGCAITIQCINITVYMLETPKNVSDSGSGYESPFSTTIAAGDLGSGSEGIGSSSAFGVSDLGLAAEETQVGYTLWFGVRDSGAGREGFDVILPHPPAPFGIQDLNLPHVLTVRRTSGSQLGLAQLPNRGFQYARQLSQIGDVWEFTGLVDRAKLEELLSLPNNGTVWFTDPIYGSFHATIEVDASWVATDAPEIEKDSDT